ncbi:unnamed protein product [Boreogadus saida]
MEDALIVAVCGQSVLYDTTLVSYRDRIKKEQAWVVVGEETGIPVDVCRRKWKSLRDRYLREKRREKEEGKRSGSAARTGKKWKFFAVLSFLDPFVTPRETSSNLPRCAEMEDDGAAETSGVGEAGEERDEAAAAAAAGPSHNTDQLSGNESDPDDVPAAAAAAAATAATPAPAPAAGPAPASAPRPQSGMKRKRASGVPCGNTPIQEAIIQPLQRDGQLCADAHFLNGLLPSLKRLPPDLTCHSSHI